ncbi:MAG: cbb3-type cytochrome c oxidase subunit 3 [Xanthomonadales bacterium]|jgi:cytochrome c oxidase cbb3-type subunit IV
MNFGLDLNIIRAAVLILLIVGFLGIWAWAWSRHRKEDFEKLSQLPLEEDDGTVPEDDKTERTKE